MNIDNLFPLIRALIYIIAGFFIARLASRAGRYVYEKRKYPKYSILLQKVIFYVVFILFLISALRELGFDLKVLLGATGVLTVAIGFASQTSASNFISGLFLLGENSLRVGDVISINGTTGEIISVDLFSVKLKQSDSTLIRIPNELMLKTQVVNLTHFRERRFDCFFSIPADTDIAKLREIVFTLLKDEPLCLSEPKPTLEIKEIGDSSIKMQLFVWAKQKNYSVLKNHVQEKLVQTLLAHHISIADGTLTVKLTGDHDVRA